MAEQHATNASESAFERLLHKVHAIGREVFSVHAADVDCKARFPQEALSALKQARLLSAYVPRDYGGMGLNILQIAKICEALGHYCASSAMIYAMHQIQVACVVHHAQDSAYFRAYLGQLAEQQRLIASATTELGVGGDLRTSICAVETNGHTFRLTKKAPVISYGEAADDILVTCRKSPDAPGTEQLQVLVRRGDYTAEPLSDWDTLGFRGTCSSGFTLAAQGSTEQILPTPFAAILAQTMHPYSHIVWSSLWLGIAGDAVNRARAFVRSEARKTPGEVPLSALRLAEADARLQQMRHDIDQHAREYHELLQRRQPEAFESFGFAVRTNNLKISSSELVVDIVGRAVLVCGIAGYRNDSKYSVTRQLRDAYGAALMVNNDRILRLNATMLLVRTEG
jgi:acyl-CoA dehydrogenase